MRDLSRQLRAEHKRTKACKRTLRLRSHPESAFGGISPNQPFAAVTVCQYNSDLLFCA
jgi:hypothetical protein